jgi:hypothetical protein
MPDAPTEPISIDLEALVGAYENARRLSESGDRVWRITPGQRIDLHRLVADLRSPGGLAECGAAPEVWTDYLAPVLAESGPARRLLKEVLLSFAPETKLPPPPPPPPTPPLPPVPTFWERIRAAVAQTPWRLVVTIAVVGALTVIVVSLFLKDPKRTLPIETTNKLNPFKPPPSNAAVQPPAQPLDLNTQAAAAYDRAMEVTLRLLSDGPKSGVTPRLLAAAHAGSDPRLGTPDTLLVNMLRGWLMPPDELLLPDASGVSNLKRLTAEIAAISSGLPRVLFEGRIAAADKALGPGMFADRSLVPPLNAAPPPWSKVWLGLAGIPYLLYTLYAAFRLPRRTNELLERWVDAEVRNLGGPPALQGIRQSSGTISVRAPEPLITREGLRALMRYRPVPGRRLDARRSVRAVLRQAGYADPIMRRIQRVVDYLVIIQRWQPHDHERLRVRQFMEGMSKRGLSMSIYDYERDPLLVRRVVAAGEQANAGGLNGREELLALPALRDLHPDARLILVTDGRDIVDRITGRVRASIIKGFSFWKERTVLTPVPVGDWGEVEFALSRDLDLPLGRTTQDMAADLVLGFQRASGRAPYRVALDRARGVAGLAKLNAWWKAVAEGFGSGARAAFGPNLLPERTLLVTDLEPSREMVAEIVRDLRRWLGTKGFLWHAGCAIYPQLRFDLTLHIGMHLRVGPHPEAPAVFRDTPSDRRTFERMTVLPWFRTGRMPEWLRRETLANISEDELDRASKIIRSLFDPRKQEGAGPLTIWWPRAGALTMPPDAVMASALAGNVRLEAPPVTPEREAFLRGAARRAVLRSQIGTAILIAGACAAAAWLVPDFSTSPHPAGAWYPLFVFILVCVMTAILCGGLRRLFPFAPKPRRLPAPHRADPPDPPRMEKDSVAATKEAELPPTSDDTPQPGPSGDADNMLKSSTSERPPA